MTIEDIKRINDKTRREFKYLKRNPKRLIKEMSMKIGGGCWLWIGNKTPSGYGYIQIEGKAFKAHRLSYLAFKGDFDQKLFVCHKCDYPSCVNPAHLFLGTSRDNTYDAIKKAVSLNFLNKATSPQID